MHSYVTWLKNWYARYERHVSSLSLIGGFVFDALTLKRVDLFIENFWVVIHMLMAAVGIILINLYETGRLKTKNEGRGHFWSTIIIQFAFGGLLSTFIVFYFRSATLASSWPFFLLLAAFFAGNELLKQHYTRLVFQISALYVSIFSFAIFLVPVLVHRIGDDVFILSGLISLIVLSFFLMILRFLTGEHFAKSRNLLFVVIGCIFVIINLMYFTNIIPPIPLALKDGEMLHSIIRNADGGYTVGYEPEPWYSFFTTETYHQVAGDPVYVYSAVFSPTLFDTKIIHRWQHYDSKTSKWVTVALINLDTIGGREGGYRTYSTLSNLDEGEWRVDVESGRGQSIGRIKFNVVNTTVEPALITEIK